jgi:hypothetical protein
LIEFLNQFILTLRRKRANVEHVTASVVDPTGKSVGVAISCLAPFEKIF